MSPDLLEQLQKDLFAIGARLADPAEKIAERVTKVAVTDADVQRLEEWIDRFEAELPPLRRFILPGGNRAGALLHFSRTVCRRAERSIVALGTDSVEAHLLAYINRLSDLLFVDRARRQSSGRPAGSRVVACPEQRRRACQHRFSRSSLTASKTFRASS